MKEVDKQRIEKAAREVLGGIDPNMDPYYFEWPALMCEVAEKAGYDPEKDFWAYPDDYTCIETKVLFAIDDIMTGIAKELGLLDLLG